MNISESAAPVADYYSQPRVVDGQARTIYQIWETGEAFNDSVTPSTYSAEYQSHIRLKLERLTGPGDRILSVGCGNAVVEGQLVGTGRHVSGIDCNAEAVEFASRKGVHARQADFLELPQGALAAFDLIYADGVVGHMCDAAEGLGRFLAALRRAGMKSGARLVISNDAPRSPQAHLEPHGSVDGFWLVSHRHLTEQLGAAGLRGLESYTFPYARPKSGLRDRSICVVEQP